MVVGGSLSNKGHAALGASFLQATHTGLVGSAFPALGADAPSTGAHPATSLSSSATTGAHAATTLSSTGASASSTEAGPCSLALAPSLSAASSSTFHLVLLVCIVFPLN